MAEVISLFNYSAGEEVGKYPFVVFESNLIDVGIFSISPEVMHLSENIFVADISVAASYWKKISEYKNLPLNTVYKNTLQKKPTNASLVVFCEHPVQGLILYKYLEDRGVEGAYESNSDFAKRAYKNVGWELWSDAAKIMNFVFDESSLLIKERKNFNSNLGRLLRFASRIKVKSFADLRKTEFYEIQRRFGSFIGLMWKWTFPKAFEKIESEPDLFNYALSSSLKGFDWIKFKPIEPVLVKSQLEYTMSTWSEIKPELEKNLLELSSFKALTRPIRVSEYSWKLTLFDGLEVEALIRFKHPVSMLSERESEFETSLMQLKIAFEKFQYQLSERAKDTDLSNVPLVIAWNLEVTGKVIIEEMNEHLFLEEQQDAKKIKDIKNFETKIESELDKFRLLSSPVPSFDFIEDESDDSRKNFSEDYSFRFLIKPLFIYTDPEAIDETKLLEKKFLDRTSSPWWESGNTDDSYRDYYMCERDDGHLIWAFKNYKGEWFVHGIYS